MSYRKPEGDLQIGDIVVIPSQFHVHMTVDSFLENGLISLVYFDNSYTFKKAVIRKEALLKYFADAPNGIIGSGTIVIQGHQGNMPTGGGGGGGGFFGGA